MSATKNFIPASLEPIYNYLIKESRVGDQEFMLRVINNKEAGLRIRKYETERLRQFEKDWFDSLPDDKMIIEPTPVGEPIDVLPSSVSNIILTDKE